MAEYIKREDAIKIAEKYGLANGSVLGRHTGLADCIASEISAIPTADVEEIKHGYWLVDICTGKLQCSVCGDDVSCDNKSPYCPNCGATLDERMVFKNGCC